LQQILRLEMAAGAVGAGDGMNWQHLARSIHRVEAGQGGVQPVEAAKVIHAAGRSDRRWNQRRAKLRQIRIAIGNDG
jgi:hypothetical protein